MGLLFGLLLMLAIIAVVGHTTWVIVREVVRWVADLGKDRSLEPSTLTRPTRNPV